MTLIVATDEPGGDYFVSQTISELMQQHPSRGIVLAVSETAEHGLAARVVAQCWKPFGKAQQICCEQIEITARPDSWPNVGPTLAGLIAADLPVIFWCRSRGALSPNATRDQQAGLKAILDTATKTVIDSLGMPPDQAFALMADWRAHGRLVADLEWTRLTQWREPISSVFDNFARRRLSDFKTIELHHGDENPSASAFYFAAWLSAPHGAQVRLEKGSGKGNGLRCVTLKSDSETIKLERKGLDCLEISSSTGRSRQYTYRDRDETSLMTEELSVLGPDPAFDTAFERARELVRGEH
jgi:glucose-6-phosphate dehydrogenase assembly protein OpcA